MLEINSQDALVAWLGSSDYRPEAAAIQGMDLQPHVQRLLELDFAGSLFLGCKLDDLTAGHIVSTGGMFIRSQDDFAFEVHRARLYRPDELFGESFDPDTDRYKDTPDYRIYTQYIEQGGRSPVSIRVSLMRRLHDHSITDALEEAIAGRKVVAVTGGHGMERQDPFFTKIAVVARKLTQKGFLMVSGGGPGAMEATHLGAYFAAFSEQDLLAAIEQIKIRPAGAKPGKEYKDPDWLNRAWKIISRHPLTEEKRTQAMSIGIPTWLYGHEPPTPFATHIAKYFVNSVREDGLLMIANHGVIFAPGSAGTIQEIFQDAAQNHYNTAGTISPMILFGKKHWTETRPVWPLLQQVSEDEVYGELVAMTDSEDEIIRRLLSFRPELYRAA